MESFFFTMFFVSYLFELAFFISLGFVYLFGCLCHCGVVHVAFLSAFCVLRQVYMVCFGQLTSILVVLF
jgi:hypothetical protein